GANGSFPSQLSNLNGTVLFRADDGVHGPELWKSDGTADGTVLVKDIYPGSSFSLTLDRGLGPMIANRSLFFTADDGVHWVQLWKSDGTTAGTFMVKDIVPDVTSTYRRIDLMGEANGTMFFAADDGVHGVELWKSDGTEAGTVLVKDIYPGGFLSPRFQSPTSLMDVNGTLFLVSSY